MLDFIACGALAGGDPSLFRPLVDSLLGDDPYMVLADYAAYVECQEQVGALWRDPRALDAEVDPERGAHGQVLLGPLHPRVLRAGLEREARRARVGAAPVAGPSAREARLPPRGGRAPGRGAPGAGRLGGRPPDHDSGAVGRRPSSDDCVAEAGWWAQQDSNL